MNRPPNALLRAAPSPLSKEGAGEGSTSHGESKELATTFLLAEHTRLCELYLSTRDTAERRATLFITLTTTILGAIIALFQFGNQFGKMSFLETAFAGAVAIVLLGVTTFHRLLERSMQGTEYLRAINRIHRYFIDRAPEAEPYLYWPAHDDVPRYDFRGVGGAETREIIVLINSVFAGAVVGLGVLLFDEKQLLPAIVAGVVTGVLSAWAHQGYERFSMAREERRKVLLIHFPGVEHEAENVARKRYG